MSSSRQYQEHLIFPSEYERELIELAKHAYQSLVTRRRFQKCIKNALLMKEYLQSADNTAPCLLGQLSTPYLPRQSRIGPTRGYMGPGRRLRCEHGIRH